MVRNLSSRNGRAVQPGAALHEQHRAAVLEPDRERDQREQRRRQQRQRDPDDQVEGPLQHHRRARDVGGDVLEHRQLREPRDLVRRGLAAQRRDQAQLRLVGAAEVRDRGDLARVDALVGQDHAVDPVRVLARLDRLHVQVAEQRQLAPHRVREAAAADDQHLLARGARAPCGPGADAQHEVEGDRDPGRDRELAGVHRPRRRQPAEQADGGGADHAAGDDRRRLVHGQVADRQVVGVIEARQLRHQQPHRQQREQPDRALGRHRADERDRDRAAVGQRQQAPPPRVAPPSRVAGDARGGVGQRPPDGLRRRVLLRDRGGAAAPRRPAAVPAPPRSSTSALPLFESSRQVVEVAAPLVRRSELQLVASPDCSLASISANRQSSVSRRWAWRRCSSGRVKSPRSSSTRASWCRARATTAAPSSPPPPAPPPHRAGLGRRIPALLELQLREHHQAAGDHRTHAVATAPSPSQ